MNNLNWERLRIFKAVLEAGSMAEAARQLGVSQPTVSRQIRVLEEELDQRLVDVTPDGVYPTRAGAKLKPILDDMAVAASAVTKAGAADAKPELVRITCGPWMALFLGGKIGNLAKQSENTIIDIVSSVAFADLPRREADIAIRNKRPKSGRIKLKSLPHFSWAAYGAKSLIKNRRVAFDERRFERFEWFTLSDEFEHFPSVRWLKKHLQKPPLATFSHSVNLLDAVRGGNGMAIMPCFAGDPDDNLRRCSKPFFPNNDGHWLVLAEDVARRPAVRNLADRIIECLEDNRAVLDPS